MRVDIYLHGNSESLWEKGEALGLTDEALRLFSFSCYEVKIELDVDEQTGASTIVAVDGRKLEPRNT